MAFLGPLLGAGASLASAFIGQGAQRDANNIQWSSLFETKRRNRETEKLAKSSRRDAYGNLLKYTPGVGWEIDTTPMTKAILDSSQKEELENLRVDAPQQRAARGRMDVRSKMGDEEFRKKFNEFRFRPRHSEEQEVGDATQLLLNSRRKGLDEASAMLARQLMRTGGSSELASVYKKADDQYVSTLQDAILQGKSLGRKNYVERESSDLQNLGGELNLLKGIADGTASVNIGSGQGYDDKLTGDRDQALAQLIGAIQSGTASNAQASNSLAQGVAKGGLDLSQVANYLGRLDFGGGENTDDIASYGRNNDPWWGMRQAGGSGGW